MKNNHKSIKIERVISDSNQLQNRWISGKSNGRNRIITSLKRSSKDFNSMVM